MTIPNLPPFYDMPYTDKDGKLTPDSHLYNDDMFQTLNQLVELINRRVTDDSINFPNKTTAEITLLEPTSALGATWFNTTLAKLQVKTAAGTVETVTSV